MEAVKKKNRRAPRKRAAHSHVDHEKQARAEHADVRTDASLDAATSGNSSPGLDDGDAMLWDTELDDHENMGPADATASTPSVDSIEPHMEHRNEEVLAHQQELEVIDQEELLAAMRAVQGAADDITLTTATGSGMPAEEEASAPPCESDDVTTSEASAENNVSDAPAFLDVGIKHDEINADVVRIDESVELQEHGVSLPAPIATHVPAVQPFAEIPVMASTTVAPSAPSFSDSEEDPHHHMFPASDELDRPSFQLLEVKPRPPEIPIGLLRKASTHVATMHQETTAPYAEVNASFAFSDSVSTHAAPSAPPDLEMEDKIHGQSNEHTPSAPSLSPTAAKMRESMASTPKRRKPEHSQTESASVTLRNSYAKTRMSDATRRLYPTVVGDNASSTAEVKGGVPAEKLVHFDPKLLAPKQRVCIKLEPHVNFEMNLLRAEAAQKRQEAKMQNIATSKGELYSRLERYLYAEYLLHTAASTMDSYKKEIDVLIQKGENSCAAFMLEMQSFIVLTRDLCI